MMGRFAILALLGLTSTTASAGTLTAFSHLEDGIVSIDTDTGLVTVIGGDYTAPLTTALVGMDYDSNGVLWGIAGSPFANVSIGTIDPTTGNYTLIGTDNIGSLSGASFAPDDKLYSRDGGHPTDFVAEISKSDATPTRIANLGVTSTVGFAITTDGLFGYTIDIWTEELLQYDFTLGTTSTIGVTASGVSALAFLGSTLYGTTNFGGTADALISIDTLTGAELTRVNLSSGVFTNISALAAAPTVPVPPTAPVPIPAGGALLLGGLCGLSVWRRLKAPV